MPSRAEKSRKKYEGKNSVQKETQKKTKKDRAGKAVEPLKPVDADELIFALDIGTRTVVGIVGLPEGDKFKVIAAEVVEHKNRAMLDGQIHDIGQVAEIARQVKESLEKRLGVILSKVAIAAAGRVLKTCQVKIEHEIEPGMEIGQELVSSLEMDGVRQAQSKLDAQVPADERTQFYCVGYSVINYYLNGFMISSLLGHKGKKVGVDVLATFLPHIVVDSLYTVMGRVGLEVSSLTLEPIAAINVTIPKDLRLLNLALVDIGAGTSDIALTRDGSVVAYAMCPIAGDEVTEKIAQHYLVDFNTAERIKVELSSGNEAVRFIDILGKKQVVSVEDISEVIKPSIEFLAETISDKIVEYNNKAPNAVFLIGGGSQIPGLTDMIAEKLHISRERVAVRGRDVIQNIKFAGKKLSGPEAITPIGIAVTAHIQHGQDFLGVSVNGSRVKLFNSKKLTVSDALILVNYNPDQLIGRRGKSLQFQINEDKKVIRGEHGKAAEIFVNDMQASLDTVLNNGDAITVIPAVNGKNAEASICDFVEKDDKHNIILNGGNLDISARYYANGREVEIGYKICDGDIIQVNIIKTLNDLIKLYELDLNNFDIFVNGQIADNTYILKNNDSIDVKKKTTLYEYGNQSELNCEMAESEAASSGEEKNLHTDMGNISYRENTYTLEDKTGGAISVLVNGETVQLREGKSQYIFVDIFNYINFDLSRPKGNITLKLNGKQAGFTDLIEQGDVIEIYWGE